MKNSSYLPAYEDRTQCSEISTYKIQKPVKYPKKCTTFRTRRKFEIKKYWLIFTDFFKFMYEPILIHQINICTHYKFLPPHKPNAHYTFHTYLYHTSATYGFAQNWTTLHIPLQKSVILYSPIGSSLVEDCDFTRQGAMWFYRRAKLSWRNTLLPSYAMKKKAEASSSFYKTIQIYNTAYPSLYIHHRDNPRIHSFLFHYYSRFLITRPKDNSSVLNTKQFSEKLHVNYIYK